MNSNVLKSLLKLTGRSNSIITMLLVGLTMYLSNLSLLNMSALTIVVLLQVNNVFTVGFVESLKNLSEDLKMVFGEISTELKDRKLKKNEENLRKLQELQKNAEASQKSQLTDIPPELRDK